MRDADVIVIGSGIAGLSCAFTLAKAGRRPLVLEAADVIGGRTASWIEDGMPVESGLHKFLGIYRTLPRLLAEAGVDLGAMLTWVDAMEIHTMEGRSAVFPAAPWRRPLATLGGLLGNARLIPWRDKLRLAAMGVRELLAYARDAEALDTRSIAQAAREAGVSDRVIRDVLHSLTSGVFFLPADEYTSYATFAPVVQGLKRGMTFGIGAFNGGMTEVMMRPLADAIAARGGEVRTGQRVTRILRDGDGVTGVETAERAWTADAVVLATALRPAQVLVREAFGDDPWFRPMLRLETLSAVTFQCELSEPAFATDHTHFSNSGVACFAEQSHTTFRESPGRLSTILFPPAEFLAMDDDRVRASAVDDLETIGVRVRDRITRWRVVRHPHDFYAMQKGSERLRPHQATPIPGFALAGDYTKQPFLASMEGAAIAGVAAAEAILS